MCGISQVRVHTCVPGAGACLGVHMQEVMSALHVQRGGPHSGAALGPLVLSGSCCSSARRETEALAAWDSPCH